MPSVGPQLPPSLTEKRKRSNDEESSDTSPTPSNSPSRTNTTPDAFSKRQRVIGPSMPPAPLEERPLSSPSQSDDESSSEDDDDFGPSLPTAGTDKDEAAPRAQSSSTQAGPAPSKRDEWMTLAPTHGDWSARVDPTKLKNRKFNTGKGAKGPPQAGGGAGDAWHETPEQKQARLQREIMGIKDNTTGSKTGSSHSRDDGHDAATAKRLQEYNKTRGPTLYEAHQKGNPQEKEDDPSARAFDREKDIGGGLQINSTKRREMMKKAGDFSSRFSSAKYL